MRRKKNEKRDLLDQLSSQSSKPGDCQLYIQRDQLNLWTLVQPVVYPGIEPLLDKCPLICQSVFLFRGCPLFWTRDLYLATLCFAVFKFVIFSYPLETSKLNSLESLVFNCWPEVSQLRKPTPGQWGCCSARHCLNRASFCLNFQKVRVQPYSSLQLLPGPPFTLRLWQIKFKLPDLSFFPIMRLPGYLSFA